MYNSPFIIFFMYLIYEGVVVVQGGGMEGCLYCDPSGLLDSELIIHNPYS